MKSAQLRLITTFIILFSFYGNSIAQVTDPVDLFSDLEPAQQIKIEDPEYLAALESVSEEDLQQEVLQRMLMFQAQQCMDDKGNIPYNKTVTINREGSDHDEIINCNDIAAMQYQIMVADQGLSERQAISCVTSGWHAEDRLSFVRDLEIPVEEALACPGKNTSSLKCMGEFVCGAYAGIAGMVPVGGAALQDWMSGWAKNTFDMNCSAGKTLSTIGNCLTEVVWGVIKNIVGNLEFVADGIRWVGNAIADGARSVGSALCFWCEDEHEDVSSDQQHLINSSEEIREQNTRQANKAEEESGNAFTRFFSNIGGFLNDMIAEPAGRNFGCAKWEGNRFTNTTSIGLDSVMGNDDNSNAVRCAEPMASWECASCSQRAQLVCGVVGFLGGEAITTLLTGGAARLAKLGATALKGTKTAARVGEVASGIARSTSRGLTSYAGRGFSLVKNTRMGSMFFQLGDKAVNVGGRFRNSLVEGFQSLRQAKIAGKSVDEIARASINGTLDGVSSAGGWASRQGIRAKRALFGKYSPLSPVKGYFNLLDDAFALGAGGKAGLLAARAARTQSQVRNSMVLARSSMPKGSKMSADLVKAQSRVDDVLGKIKSLTDEAKNTKISPARKAQINNQMTSLSREYNAVTKGFEDAYRTARTELTAQRTAAKELAQRQAKELAEQQARAAREAATNSRQSNALVPYQANNPPAVQRTVSRNSNTIAPTTTRSITNTNQSVVTPISRNLDTVPRNTRTINQALPSGWNPVTSGRNLSGSEVARVTSNLEEGLETGSILRYNVRRANGSDTWLYNAKTNPVTGEISGNLGRSTNRNVTTFKLDEVELLQAKVDMPIDGVASIGGNSRTIPLNFKAVTDPDVAKVIRQAGNATSPQAVRELEGLMKGMKPDQIRQIGAEAIRNLQAGRAASPGQVAAYLKSMPGYRTLDNIPHLDDAVRAMNAGSIDDAMEIIDNAVRGSSPQTAMIRDSLKDAITTTMILRAPTGAIAAGNMGYQAVRETNVTTLPSTQVIRNGDVITDPARLLPAPSRSLVPTSTTAVVPTSTTALTTTGRTGVVGVVTNGEVTGAVVRNIDEVSDGVRGTVGAGVRTGDDIIYVDAVGNASRNLDGLPLTNTNNVLRSGTRNVSDNTVGLGSSSRGARIPPTVGGRVIAGGTVVGAVLNNNTEPDLYTGVTSNKGERQTQCYIDIYKSAELLTDPELARTNVTYEWLKEDESVISGCTTKTCDYPAGIFKMFVRFKINNETYINTCTRVDTTSNGGNSTLPNYSLSAVYISGSPPTCEANISKTLNDQETELDASAMTTDKITIKWFKEEAATAGSEICSGSISCAMPASSEKLYLRAYKDNTQFGTSTCQEVGSRNPAGPNITRPYDVKDEKDGDRNGSDIDMASQFYEQQRSPPPSLFQAAPIPRRPTHYLHSGWY